MFKSKPHFIFVKNKISYAYMNTAVNILTFIIFRLFLSFNIHRVSQQLSIKTESLLYRIFIYIPREKYDTCDPLPYFLGND